jgi:hypothetical protein
MKKKHIIMATYDVTPETIGLTVDALVREGYRVTCPRCKREIDPWPLDHKSCSPKDWVKCISTGVSTIYVGEIKCH